MNKGSYYENDDREDVQILTGPRVDACRVALITNDAVDGWGRDLLRNLRRIQTHRIANQAGHTHDLLSCWPRPDEAANSYPVDVKVPGMEPCQYWDGGSCKVLPKLNGSILADITSPDDGPGWLRIRDTNPTKRAPYAVILDLASSWIWQFETIQEAVQNAVAWWRRAGILSDYADSCLFSGAAHRVTRLDICADHFWAPVDGYYGRDRWTPLDHAMFVTRAKAKGFAAGERVNKEPTRPASKAYFGPRSFTLYIGKRGNTGPMFRIYDKTAELAAKRPAGASTAWFWHPVTDLWTSKGWDRKATVWRCEVECPSKMLHSLDGGTARMSNLAAVDVARIWAHCLGNTRHTIDEDSKRSRDRRTSTVWDRLTRAVHSPKEITKIPDNPSQLAPDLDAVRRAVKQAVALGADQHKVMRTVFEAVNEGRKEQSLRDVRREQVAAVEERHANSVNTGLAAE